MPPVYFLSSSFTCLIESEIRLRFRSTPMTLTRTIWSMARTSLGWRMKRLAISEMWTKQWRKEKRPIPLESYALYECDKALLNIPAKDTEKKNG